MIPVSLSLRNFLSYGENVATLDFTQFHVACLSGDNGHGKSALLDAMTYALWGEARKNQYERKPDEGLLRIGSSEMQVEFTFDLDGERYRVIRSYRKRSKRGTAQLELQIFDETVDTYRSLSEGDSLTRTQARVIQLLCMDYNTFTNSAFIVQGQADAFTEKNARQRKEILSQILGLERYDRLQGLARERFQNLDQQNRETQLRLTKLDEELSDKEEHERELKEVNIRLHQLVTSLAELDKELEELREKRREHQRIQEHLKVLELDTSELKQRLETLDKERHYLEKQQREDGELLKSEADIQRDFAIYQKLQLQVNEQDRKMQSLRELENRRHEVQMRITDARHEVEQRLQTHAALRDDRDKQLRENRSLLEQEEQVLANFTRLTELRQNDQAQENKRIRYEALRHERDQLQHGIALQQQDLNSQRNAVEKQLEMLEISLENESSINKRARELALALATLEEQARERDRLKDLGSGLRVQIDEQQKQRRENEENLVRERKRILEQQQQDDARCPLCGSQLDEAHRQQLDDELAKNEREQQERLDEQGEVIAALERELEEMRARYRKLELQTAAFEALRKESNECGVRCQQLGQQRGEAEQLRLRASELKLEAEQCAHEERKRLLRTEGELQALDYQTEAHRAAKQSIADLQETEGAYARLQNARTQVDKLTTEKNEVQEKVDLAQKYLDEKLYAPKEQEQLTAVQQQIDRLAYDGTAHQELRDHLDALSTVFTLQNNLQTARERRARDREALARTNQSIKEAQVLQQQRAREREELIRKSTDVGDIDKRFTQRTERQAQERSEHEKQIERRGTLRDRCERSVRLIAERNELQKKAKSDQSDAWVYQSLDEAFGKDGIQALIIESAVPQIEKEANAILSRLTDNRIQISIESLRDLKTGGTRETLDIKIADEIGERSYHLYSGGEAFRTNFALRIALSKVLAMRAGTQLRTLIIDEGFGTQDSHGLEQLIEAIREISRDFDKVLVVTHLSELKKVFPVQIEVTKYPDIGSRFEVVHLE